MTAPNSQATSPGTSALQVGSFDADAFVYRFLPADQSLSHLAQRFRIDEAAIRSLNGHGSSWYPPEGEVLRLPRPTERRSSSASRSPFVWEAYEVEGAVTLAGLLERLQAKGYLAPLWTDNDALAIWRYWQNAQTRDAVLVRTPDANQNAAGPWQAEVTPLPSVDVVEMGGPDAVMLKAGDVIFLPMVPMATHPVAVAPDATATIEVGLTPFEAARRGLYQIQALLDELAKLRIAALRIQAECTACIRILGQLRTIVDIEQKQFDAYPRDVTHRHHDDAGRAQLKAALDSFAEKAIPALLHDPQATLDPTLVADSRRVLAKLIVDVKRVELRRLLDVTIPTYGEMPCSLSDPTRNDNLVEAVCSVAVQAAYWMGEAGEEDGYALLSGALTTMAGTKSSAQTTTSIIDYAAGLAAAGATFSPSCDSLTVYGCAGAITSAYISAGLATKGTDPQLSALRVRAAVKKLLGAEVEEVLDATATTSSHEEGGSTASSVGSATADVTARLYGANEKVQGAMKALPKLRPMDVPDDPSIAAGAAEAAEGLKRTKKWLEFISKPETKFPQLAGALPVFKSVWKLLSSAYSATSKGEELFAGLSGVERLKAILSEVKSGLDVTSAAIQIYQRLNLADKAVIARTSLFFGRVSMVVGIIVESVAAYDAFRADKTAEGVLHCVAGAGMVLLLFTPLGPVFLWIGGAAVVVGGMGSAFPDFFTLRSGARQFFDEGFKRLTATATKFAPLRPDCDVIPQLVNSETFQAFDAPQLMPYEDDLAAVGLDAADIAH